MTKNELRKIFLEKRQTLAPTDRNQFSKQIAEMFFQNFSLSKINYLHCFLTIEKFNEIDTRIILERVWDDFPNIETVVPRVNKQKDMLENLRFTEETGLIQSAWGINEPAGNDFVETEKIDLVLVPLLCFDRRGFRVGYGKGFYDKFLINCRQDCLKIGLSYFAPVDEITDVHEFDVKLDFCILPNSIIKFT